MAAAPASSTPPLLPGHDDDAMDLLEVRGAARHQRPVSWAADSTEVEPWSRRRRAAATADMCEEDLNWHFYVTRRACVGQLWSFEA